MQHIGNPSQCQRQTLAWSKGLENSSPANNTRKQAGEAILISYKIDFQIKVVKKETEGHFILIKGKVYQEELSVLNTYVPNTRATSFVIETTKAQSTHWTSHNNCG